MVLGSCTPPIGSARPDTLKPVAAVPSSHSGLSADQRLEDIDALFAFVERHYPFFDEKATDWQRVHELYRPKARAADSDLAFLHVVESVLDELYDPHCMLNTNAPDSWRPVPGQIWAQWHGKATTVTAVRSGSAAARAGVVIGDVILAVDGEPISERVAKRMPKALARPDENARAWALLSAVAGRHEDRGVLTLRRVDGTQSRVAPGESPGSSVPAIQTRTLGGVGYIAISSFQDPETVRQFDTALDRLMDTRALIIDVRNNGGGDTAVAVPIMGRLVVERAQYAWMARREGGGLGPRWPEFIEPRGATYQAPVVVLVDRFSVSMAEGFAMGLSGIGRAQTVGTVMAGLGAGIARVHLTHLDVSAQISAEPIYAVDGTKRWELRPDIEVDMQQAGGLPDPILARALALLKRP